MMIGRAAYANPYLFTTVDKEIFEDNSKDSPPTREQVVQAMVPHISSSLLLFSLSLLDPFVLSPH